MDNQVRRSKSNKVLLPKNNNADKQWINKELTGCKFKDKRLGKRFKSLFSQISGSIGETFLIMFSQNRTHC